MPHNKPHNFNPITRWWRVKWASLWNKIHNINGADAWLFVFGIVLAACLITYYFKATVPEVTE